MTDQERKAMQMALDALECSMEAGMTGIKVDQAIEALRQALAQPEQEPVIDRRLKVKIGRQYGYALNEHWFYLQPADEYAEQALTKHSGISAPPSKPDDLLRQSEQEGWRWAKECEAEVKRLRTLLAEGGQGCGECGVTVSDGYALYCVKCVEPMFKKEWVSLTDEDFDNIYNRHDTYDSFARAIEAALRSKNT